MGLSKRTSSTLDVPAAGSSPRPRSWRGELRQQMPFYLMALPAVVAVLVFSYGPLFGLVIGFLDYSPFLGLSGSEWVGLENFRTAFDNPFFTVALRNSLVISTLKLALGFPAALLLALLLNEARVRWLKVSVQTASILPFFISWVVVGTMFRALLGTEGALNEVRTGLLGWPGVSYLSDPQAFRWVIIFQDVWKGAGYGAILYLAAMASIDPALYEAAEVDGASRWGQLRHITLPGISGTMITLFVIAVGYLASAGFEQLYVMYNVSVLATADILETFTLRLGLEQSDYGLATAVGLFQGVISLTLVGVANFIVRRSGRDGLF